ncbi:VP1 [Bat associated densovirus]|uniref:VP1 n=1 Tax=Bat-associated densovirus 2 TaxID=3070185 RepID=A0A7M1PVN3_9VIRU|nr:VP1 [Bat associated densovirus]QOR29554.1 VP1 [Bat-associated densovirus 2]
MRSLGPPIDERENWPRMRRTERRYALAQYNRARTRRGLPLYTPIADRQEGEPEAVNEEEVDDPEPAGLNEQEQDYVDDFELPLLDNQPEAQEEQDLDEILNQPVNQANLEAVLNELTHAMDQPGTSGTQGVSSTIVSPHKGATASPKNPASTEAGGDRKRLKGASLPGTSSGMGGGDMERGIEPVPRPFYSAHKQIRHFKKVHRLLTFGLAYKPVAVPKGVAPYEYNDVYMVTSLAHIPWDRPFMYLNPAEFNLLPLGSRVRAVRCSVRSENVRIAFPTNASESNLATLNQNKFLRVGIGLNQKIQCVNAQPGGFMPTQPMIATKVSEMTSNSYDNWVTNFYGVSNSDTTLPDVFTTQTPRHQFGIPWVAQYYCCPVTQTNDKNLSGWEDFQCQLEEIRVEGPTGNIIDMEYKPALGLLKAPLNAIWTGLPSNGPSTNKVNVNMGSGNNQFKILNQIILNNVMSEPTEKNQQWGDPPKATDFSITGLIEKNQLMCAGILPSYRAKAQPSIHVGVMPVPALTTKAIEAEANNNSFTDSQAYFEITCEMEVECAFPTYRPLAGEANVHMNDVCYSARATELQPGYTMAYGLYQHKV